LQLRSYLQQSENTRAPRLSAIRGPARVPAAAALIERCAEVALWPVPAAVSAQGRVVYVNTSHGQLFRPAVARWLQRTGLPAVFLVHDLIPLQFPEYSRAREPARHAARIATIARYASRVIVNSQATAAALRDYCRGSGLRAAPLSVIPLGVEPVPARLIPPIEPARPYFVALGTLEARKNHALLLELWQRFAQAGGTPPRLVLLGRRGWENRAALQRLDRSPALAPLVAECAGLDDAAVAAVLRGARALLTPSFAEGYGLPVAEALRLGVPVIASDLPAHREVGGRFADYLDPLDDSGWAAAIGARAAESSADCARRRAALAAYRPPAWPAHLHAALPLIAHSARADAGATAPIDLGAGIPYADEAG
jgi:glycosyltransferase involved in cell wall biosynthesis